MLLSEILQNSPLDQFVRALNAVPGVVATDILEEDLRWSGIECDARLELTVQEAKIDVLVELRRHLFPRDTQRLLLKAHSVRGQPDKNAVVVVVAESISQGAREVLMRDQLGYFDLGGSLYLPAPGAFIFIDKPVPKAAERSLRNLFSRRKGQVMHAALINYGHWFGVGEIAEIAQVAPSTAAYALAELDKLDWTQSRGAGPAKERLLVKPGALLDAWAAEVRSRPRADIHRYFVPGARATNILEMLNDAFRRYNVRYAMTHDVAAQIYAPFLSHVSQVRCRAVMDSHLIAALASLDAKPVTEGANLSLIASDDGSDLLFSRMVDGTPLVSPIQAYLDLQTGEGRSKDLAEHLRKERIRFDDET